MSGFVHCLIMNSKPLTINGFMTPESPEFSTTGMFIHMDDYTGNKYFSGFFWPWYMPEVDDYKKIIAEFKFREIKVREINADRFFPDADAMIKWIDQPSLVPLIKNVEKKDKPDFRNTVIMRMLEETKQEDGTCFETFRRLNVYARK